MSTPTSRPLATVRASSWPGLFDCAQRFYWQDIVGLRGPGNGRSAVGTAVHAGTALFDQARLDGQPVSVGDAVEASFEALTKPAEEVVYDEGMTRRDAESMAVLLTTRYCQDIAPTRTYAAVELQCTALDIVTNYGTVRVTGTTDRVRVLEDGRLGITDVKTGAAATELDDTGRRRAVTRPHGMQLGIYVLMAEHGTGQRIDGPAEIVALQTTKGGPCATGEIADVKTPLLGTEDLPGLIEMAAQLLASGLFPPNPKSLLCSKRYCAAHGTRCKYHG